MKIRPFDKIVYDMKIRDWPPVILQFSKHQQRFISPRGSTDRPDLHTCHIISSTQTVISFVGCLHECQNSAVAWVIFYAQATHSVQRQTFGLADSLCGCNAVRKSA